MCKEFLPSGNVSLVLLGILFSASVFGQPELIADKNNTRPEITREFTSPAMITSFTAVRNNGYNDIQWTSRGEQETRKFIVEYSLNGVDFQSAGEALATPAGIYQLKHQTFEMAPLLYRVRTEDLNGKYYYSRNVLLDGIALSPVKIYPTIITGNVVNVISEFPVERIAVYAGNGNQVYTQDVNGKAEYMAVTLPASLSKGLYLMNFTGQGWKTTTRFIIP